MLFADLDLARRLELADAAKHIRLCRGAGEAARHGLLRVGADRRRLCRLRGADNPYSRVVGLGLDGPVSEAAFEQAEAFYRRRGAQPAFSLCPLADPTLLEHLNRRGYQVEMFMHVWYRPLVPGETFPAPPSGVVVRAIEPEEADLWTLVAFRGGLDSDEALPNDSVIIAPYPFMAQRALLAGMARRRASRRGHAGDPRRCGGLVRRQHRVPHRNRGVQHALIAARLAAAAADGCDLAVVHTEPGSDSQRNVERLGFRLAYTKVTMRSAKS